MFKSPTRENNPPPCLYLIFLPLVLKNGSDHFSPPILEKLPGRCRQPSRDLSDNNIVFENLHQFGSVRSRTYRKPLISIKTGDLADRQAVYPHSAFQRINSWPA